LNVSAFVKEVEVHGPRMFENEVQGKAFRPKKWKEMENGKILFRGFRFDSSRLVIWETTSREIRWKMYHVY
jgi:hypothetical protein